MAKARIEISGDSAELVKAYQQAREEAAKLREENAKLAQDSRRHHDEHRSDTNEEIEGLKHRITHLFSIGHAAEFAKEIYHEWREEMRELAREAEAAHQVMARAIASAGDVAQAHELTEFFEHVPGAKKGDVAAAFRGASDALPMADLETRKAIAAEVAGLAGRSGHTLVEDPNAFARLVGEMQKLSPGSRPQDMIDLALAARQMAGAKGEELLGMQNLQAMGMLVSSGAASLPEAMGLSLEAIQRNVSLKQLVALASAVEEPGGTVSGAGRYLKPEETRQNAFVAASPAERLEMLLADEELRLQKLGHGGAAKFGLMTDEGRAEMLRRLEEADQGEYRNVATRQIRGSSAGEAEAVAYANEAELERQRSKDEILARLIEMVEPFIESRQRAQGASTTGVLLNRYGPSGWISSLGAGIDSIYRGDAAYPERVITRRGGDESDLRAWREMTDALYRQIELQQEGNDLLRAGQSRNVANPELHRE